MQLTQRGDRPGGFDLTTDEAAQLHVSLKVIRQGCEQQLTGYLEKKIQTKDEVLAELMAEHVALKKRLCQLGSAGVDDRVGH